MTSFNSQIKATPDQAVLASVNAKVTFLSQQFQQVVDNQRALQANIDKVVASMEKGFDKIESRIDKEAKHSRSVTRLWGSFGFGAFSMAVRWVLNKLGIDLFLE